MRHAGSRAAGSAGLGEVNSEADEGRHCHVPVLRLPAGDARVLHELQLKPSQRAGAQVSGRGRSRAVPRGLQDRGKEQAERVGIHRSVCSSRKSLHEKHWKSTVVIVT